jgi:MFS family permease
VLGHPVLRNISMMMALINLLAATTQAQLVLFAKERLGADDSGVGFLYAAGALGITTLSLLAGPVRKQLSFGKAALGALMLYGLLIAAFAATSLYWIALPLWALASGLGIFFNINTSSLRQAMVPDRMLGRVQSVAAVLAWSAIPVGAFFGGLAIERTGNVALVYGTLGTLVFLTAPSFSFTALGHAERYLPKQVEPETRDDEAQASGTTSRETRQ